MGDCGCARAADLCVPRWVAELGCGVFSPDCGDVLSDWGVVLPDWGVVPPGCGVVPPDCGDVLPDWGVVPPGCCVAPWAWLRRFATGAEEYTDGYRNTGSFNRDEMPGATDGRCPASFSWTKRRALRAGGGKTSVEWRVLRS
jgi:hypothetical protein